VTWSAQGTGNREKIRKQKTTQDCLSRRCRVVQGRCVDFTDFVAVGRPKKPRHYSVSKRYCRSWWENPAASSPPRSFFLSTRLVSKTPIPALAKKRACSLRSTRRVSFRCTDLFFLLADKESSLRRGGGHLTTSLTQKRLATWNISSGIAPATKR